MNVPAQLYLSESLLDEAFGDRSLEQLVNVATLPGIQKAAIAMPDIHEGYGFPIGTVAATLYPDGVISPGGIGYDINCGVRLLTSKLSFETAKPYFSELVKKLFREIPSGVGRGGGLKLSRKQIDDVLKGGADWIIKEGYGDKNDTLFIESGGVLSQADPSHVSQQAKERGLDQLGTMGAGNHFVEVDVVTSVIDMEKARKLGLFQNQIVVLIHTGSRGLGHQVATDYIRLMLSSLHKYNISLADPKLACAPFSSKEGSAYFSAMAAAANFAWANRQMITQEVRKVWEEVFGKSPVRRGKSNGTLAILYDLAHNIAKIEEHEILGVKKKVIVHRKGATRAFPGQPVIIPGSMGTASYVLVGTEKGMQEAFGSSCHGAGRRMSRKAARKEISSPKLLSELEEKGIYTKSGSVGGLVEEAPVAYKDIDEVVDVIERAGMAKKVVRLRPCVVVKG